jgi:predicted ferric reductase
MYDRILRAGKLCWSSFGNYAIITPLPNNAVLLKLRRPIQARPGSHAFLWIPSIRWFETHPFTMASTNPVHFVIRAHDGFTRDLHDAAQSSPGRSLRCAIDGGYGQVPKFENFEKVILVAGGSGASFTIPVALDLIKESRITKATKSIDFIWIVRHHGKLL